MCAEHLRPGNDGARQLAEALGDAPQVTLLGLQGAELSALGLRALTDALLAPQGEGEEGEGPPKAAQSLLLGHNSLLDEGGVQVGRLLGAGLLQTVDLELGK